MPIENEVKREMVRLLLSSSNFEFQHIEDIVVCAEKLTDFITGKNQTQEPRSA